MEAHIHAIRRLASAEGWDDTAMVALLAEYVYATEGTLLGLRTWLEGTAKSEALFRAEEAR